MRINRAALVIFNKISSLPVPGPPKGVKAVVKSPRSVIVSWLEPEQPNGAVERYHIYLRSVGIISKSI